MNRKGTTLTATRDRPPQAATRTMTAIVQHRYGSAPEDVLELAEAPRPTIGDDEVLVRVRAASVDRGTWHIMAGLAYPIRLAGFGLRRPKFLNPGRSASGTVEAVGAKVTGFKPGDEVYGTAAASFAEYASARATRMSRKPANLSHEQAAALPVSGLTALQAVRDRARVRPGEKVLIIGASGGVGTFAVQIAKAFGAEVTGVSSTAKMDLVRRLGADYVIDYTREDIGRERAQRSGASGQAAGTKRDIADGGRRYDVILDIGGNRRLAHLRRALTPRGRLVIVGGETGGRWLDGLDRQLRAHLLSPFVSQTLGSFIASENADDLAALRELVESGQVSPAVDRVYPLSETPAAVRDVQDGRARGKVVIAV